MKMFRYDINGLRAYAVLAVVLYHFGIAGFSGGFVGVDIFFVISGYLMTGIILSSIQKGNFSFLKFYLSRAIRILPALLFLSVVILATGYFLLLFDSYKTASLHVLSSINFFSNITYWRESGYFDVSSHEKILLHTWSLSVEWQFYLLYPIFIFCLYKIKPSIKFFASFLIVAFFISLGLAIYFSFMTSASFYLLPFRAWELFAGGLVFLLKDWQFKYHKFTEILGFIFIALSIALFSKNTAWPSYNALLPVTGAFLVLLANQQNSVFTKPKIFQWFGDTSYSIYLWHWPIVFYLYYTEKFENNIYIYIYITIILTWLVVLQVYRNTNTKIFI